MKSQTPSINSKSLQTDKSTCKLSPGLLYNLVLARSGTKQAEKSQTSRQLTPAAKAARLDASRKYRWKNEEILREKARTRMAARRQAMKDSTGVSEAYAEGVKKAHETYRNKQRKYLAFKQRLRRQEAYIAKYGAEAYHTRAAQDQARAEAALVMQAAEIRSKQSVGFESYAEQW
ncbi:hypothetical protein R3P38DRAFT_2763170 [Favolaschia claudopus]|uniref:Uncharacterized protein n=1 Tax=Favolaschia claudopus TaxID=2862362 RepID=A0AAW0DFK2_9AGAR